MRAIGILSLGFLVGCVDFGSLRREAPGEGPRELTGELSPQDLLAPGDALSPADAAGGADGGTATDLRPGDLRTGPTDLALAQAGKPNTVNDLRISAATSTTVTLAFTEVNDGTGQPAKYDVRLQTGTTVSWGQAGSVSEGTCTTAVQGTEIGAARTCTVLGLIPNTTYSFELVPFRGTLSISAVFGDLSNIATGATAQ